MAWDFELVAGPYGGATDGPVWDGSGVIFSSVGESCIRRYDPLTRQATVYRSHWIRVKGLAFGADGTLYGCQSGSRRIVRFNSDGSASPLRARLDGELHNCPDDLAIDRQGRIWFSDPHDPVQPRGPDIRPFLPHQSVLRLERTDADAWRLRRVTLDSRCPRGVVLAPDERTLYVADSEDSAEGAHEVRAYPLQDDTTLGTGRVVRRFGPEFVGVDGLRLDAQGNVLACVAAAHGPGAICVLSPDGAIRETHVMPEGQPTSCAFGEGSLYVTTSEGHLFAAVGTT
jgi:gluconolactonase